VYHHLQTFWSLLFLRKTHYYSYINYLLIILQCRNKIKFKINKQMKNVRKILRDNKFNVELISQLNLNRLKIKGKSLSGFWQKKVVKLIFGGGYTFLFVFYLLKFWKFSRRTLFIHLLFLLILQVMSLTRKWLTVLYLRKVHFYTVTFFTIITSYVYNKKTSALQLSFSTVWFI